MNERIAFVRFPVLLILLFFIGKLIVGTMGGSYELGNRLFAMVPLTVHLCLAWGAFSRYKGEGVGSAAKTGILIALAAQILIFSGTLVSYLLGASTHFNNPVAVVGEDREVLIGEAMVARGAGIIVNAIIGAVAGSIGWALGRLIPAREA